MNQHLTNSNFEPNLLHENSLGYILQCEECKEITVGIKSIMFFCSVKILKDFSNLCFGSLTSWPSFVLISHLFDLKEIDLRQENQVILNGWLKEL